MVVGLSLKKRKKDARGAGCVGLDPSLPVAPVFTPRGSVSQRQACSDCGLWHLGCCQQGWRRPASWLCWLWGARGDSSSPLSLVPTRPAFHPAFCLDLRFWWHRWQQPHLEGRKPTVPECSNAAGTGIGRPEPHKPKGLGCEGPTTLQCQSWNHSQMIAREGYRMCDNLWEPLALSV